MKQNIKHVLNKALVVIGVIVLVIYVNLTAEPNYVQEREVEISEQQARQEQQRIDKIISHHESQGRDVEYDNGLLIIKK